MFAYLFTPIVSLSKVSNWWILLYLKQNLIPLLIFERVHFAKYQFYQCFSAKYWTGHQCFIHRLELYWYWLEQKKSIPDWHLFITQKETKWTKWYAMTSHVIAYRSLELLFGTHTFHFNCFLRILIAYSRKYAAYLGCCPAIIFLWCFTSGE